MSIIETDIVPHDVIDLLIGRVEHHEAKIAEWRSFAGGQVRREAVFGEPPLTDAIKEKSPDITPPATPAEAINKIRDHATAVELIKQEWNVG